VTSYWPGGDTARDDDALARADVIVLTGGPIALAALRDRLPGMVVAHGPRVSAALVARAALADAGDVADALALDVAMHDQRGCLSPHAVWVEGDARGFAHLLARALDTVAERLPAAPAAIEERAAGALLAAEAEWCPGAEVLQGPGGRVVYDEITELRPTPGLRTVRVHPLEHALDLPGRLPRGMVECVAVAGVEAASLAGALRARGVSRLCRPGRMQRPRVSWPRGQHAPLGVLLGRRRDPEIEVEP
jgi:acyl-CoA reductase LuxC